jgi:hypothetical protein
VLTRKAARTAGALFAGLVVAVGATVGLYVALGADAGAPSDVPKIAARLAATDFRAAPDRQTGLRPLLSVLAPPTEFDAVAFGANGTLALAVRQSGVVRVIRLRDGAQLSADLENVDAVTALAVDPGGVVYIGLRQGGYAHIEVDGSVHQDATLVGGYSIVGFAFDPASPRAAVMLAGGEVRTGERPLSRAGLRAVTMPEGARAREMTFDGDGDLWVAGDAGAVHRRTDNGWEERNVMTPGRVTAFGTGPGGDVVVGQAGGQIYRQSGGGWSLIGQVGFTPIAVGSDDEDAVRIAGADGSLYREADDGFVSLAGYDKPAGNHAVHDAVVLGPVAAFVTPERAWVFDDALWDSSDERVTAPEGAEGRVVPFGPFSDLSSEAAPVLFVLEGDDARLRRYEAGRMVALDEIAYQGTTVTAGALRAATRAAVLDRRFWLEDALHVFDARGLSRFDAGVGFTELARFPDGAGRLLSASATTGDDTTELLTIMDTGVVYRARLDEVTTPFEVTVPHQRFQALYGSELYPTSASIVALGLGRGLVVHDRERVTCIDFEADALTPLDLDGEGTIDGLRAIEGGAVVLKGDAVLEIDAEMAVHPWVVPPGIRPRMMSRRGQPLFALRAGDALLGGENQGRTVLLRCRDRRCAVVPLPLGTTPAAVYFGDDAEVLVWGQDGVLSVLPLGAG